MTMPNSSTVFNEFADYFYEFSGKFAEHNPGIAEKLADLSFDPDTLRLEEGFIAAFSQIKRLMNNQVDHLFLGFFELFAPHYFRPIPAMTVLQFQTS